jgi:P27 family predicted phage terminase small subunit
VAVRVPAKPAWLKGEAAEEWRRVVPQLQAAGVLSKLDRSILVRYCQSWQDWCELTEALREDGRLSRGGKGPQRSPAWLARNDAERVLDELGRQLGLTPVARTRADIRHDSQPGMKPPGPQQPITDFAAERRRRLLEEPS